MKKLFFIFLFFIYIALVFAGSDTKISEIENKLTNGQIKEAKSLLTQLIKIEPKNDKALYLLAKLELNNDNFDKTIDLLNDAIKINPKVSDYYVLLGGAYGTKINNVSIFKKAFIAPKIKKLFLKAVEVDKNNINAHFSLMQYYLFAPSIAGGSFEKANEEAKLIEKLDIVQGCVAKSMIYKKQGNVELALKNYEKTLRLYPKNEKLKFNYIYLLIDNKKYDKAYNLLKEILSGNNENQMALYQIGKIGAISGEYLDEAENCITKYLNLKHDNELPSNAWANYRLGMVYEKLGNLESAKKCYFKAFDQDEKLSDAKKAYERLKN